MHLFKQHEVQDYRAAARLIPMIDYGPFFAGSTPHGILKDSGKDRYSIAFFYSPNPDSVIECAPSCTSSDNPPHYPPAVYRDLVLEFYRANYFHQKGHRSEVAAAAERHSVFRPAPAGS